MTWSSPPNSCSASASAVSVLPTPDGPTSRKTPFGLLGLSSPARAVSTRLAIGVERVVLADHAPRSALLERRAPRRSRPSSIRPTGMPVQLSTTEATAWPSTAGRTSGASPCSACELGLQALQHPVAGYPPLPCAQLATQRQDRARPASVSSLEARLERREPGLRLGQSAPRAPPRASASDDADARVSRPARRARPRGRRSGAARPRSRPGVRMLAHRHPRAGGVEHADRLVGQLPALDVAAARAAPPRRPPRPGAGPRGASPAIEAMPRSIRTAWSSSGSSTFTGWKRRVSAASFSMCFLYSAQVVAAMVRSVPRASAGLSRLAASPVPAAPPAPISVCASSMNRTIGRGERLHLVDHLLAAGSRTRRAPRRRPASTARSSARRRTSLQRRRHVAGGDAQRQALDQRRLADAGLADDDRVVLPAPHQDVDDLADLAVAAEHRVDACRRAPAR